MENYTRWKWHGECSYAVRHCLSEGSESVEQIPDLGGNEDVGVLSDEDHEISPDSNKFMQFVEDGDKPLYPSCTKSTKMNGFVPGSVNLAKKTLFVLGMKYEKIDACPNDCILYRDLDVDAKKCPSCNASRWKLAKDGSEKVGVPVKTLWYFPPIPRFRRMFQSTIFAKELTWNARGRKKDGMMRYPADSLTWKMRKYMMLTLLISGPKQPGNDIDVYLQPLVDDLKVLWDGIERMYDSVRGEYFKLKAVFLWTINNLPAYENLSRCVVKGYNACPICVDQTKLYRLKHSKKLVFLRNRRQLPRHHPYQKQASAFNSTIEKDDAPTPLTGEETFARVQGLPKASGNTKDGVAARLDMDDMGIHTDLKPTVGVKRDKLPLASWNLWMYPFERYMKVFKGMVHNQTFLEGCIAECYIVEEEVEFLEERMLPEDATIVGIPKSSRPRLLNGCKRLSALKIVTTNGKLPDIPHLCILQNYEDVQPYFMEHMEFLELSFPYNINNPKWMKDKQNQTFLDWWLAGGPNKEVPPFHGYHVNGVDFNTMEQDSKRSIQNSGVFLVADAMQVASAKDKRPTIVDMDFYGRIQQIWEVDYYKFRIKDETVYFSN
uniref:uncharacterized protein LOC101299640 n=1 Tax=Fragaria vesca subsp. vesca TaxID=101020 RepID=UPI0005C952F9|nr:PREDICTED: uncharacterized protein LOC101299640 [Fragaria vesca subsp. vesca]